MREILENRIFRSPDLDGVTRGWEIHRERPLRRVYRDPRWNSIVACDDCQGTGLEGARPCPGCAGQGRIQLVDVEPTIVPTTHPPVGRAL